MANQLKNLRCCLCGQEHSKLTAKELLADGWHIDGLSSKNRTAKRVTCRVCGERIFGRQLREDEFRLPDSKD